MGIEAAAIRTVITEVMQGDTGIIHPSSGTFAYGAFDGQPDAAKLAKLTQTSTGDHWFDVILSPATNNAASNLSTNTSRRLLNMTVEIPVWTRLATEVQESQRGLILANIASDCEDAIQSLAWPDNLAETDDEDETGIVGGCMSGPDGTGSPTWQIESEDWGKRWIKSVITGLIIVFVPSLFFAIDNVLTHNGETVTFNGETVTWSL